MLSQPIIRVLPDAATLALEAARYIVDAARQAIDARGRFTIALAGGSTPRATYEHLAREPARSTIDWANVEVFFGDERCVPPDHLQSNYRTANETLLSKVPIAPDNVHRMRGEIDPHEAAKEYGQMLKDRFGETGGLDLILLGMGEDGHTASLFPYTEALIEMKHRCVANEIAPATQRRSDEATSGNDPGPRNPDPGTRSIRITLTAPFINRSHQVLILVAGESKATRVDEVLQGPRDPQRLPIQLIDPLPGQLIWLLDAAAAGMA